jgi:hypothetical protein
MLNNKNIGSVTFAVTFSMFMVEAIMHFNMGVHKDSDEKDFVLPPRKDLIKLAVITGAFSILNGLVVNELSKR